MKNLFKSVSSGNPAKFVWQKKIPTQTELDEKSTKVADEKVDYSEALKKFTVEKTAINKKREEAKKTISVESLKNTEYIKTEARKQVLADLNFTEQDLKNSIKKDKAEEKLNSWYEGVGRSFEEKFNNAVSEKAVDLAQSKVDEVYDIYDKYFDNQIAKAKEEILIPAKRELAQAKTEYNSYKTKYDKYEEKLTENATKIVQNNKNSNKKEKEDVFNKENEEYLTAKNELKNSQNKLFLAQKKLYEAKRKFEKKKEAIQSDLNNKKNEYTVSKVAENPQIQTEARKQVLADLNFTEQDLKNSIKKDKAEEKLNSWYEGIGRNFEEKFNNAVSDKATVLAQAQVKKKQSALDKEADAKIAKLAENLNLRKSELAKLQKQEQLASKKLDRENKEKQIAAADLAEAEDLLNDSWYEFSDKNKTNSQIAMAKSEIRSNDVQKYKTYLAQQKKNNSIEEVALANENISSLPDNMKNFGNNPGEMVKNIPYKERKDFVLGNNIIDNYKGSGPQNKILFNYLEKNK